MSASSVSAAMRAGVGAAGARAVVFSGSDGGDGLLEAVSPLVVDETLHQVTGALGKKVEVRIAWIKGGAAVVESRLACGQAAPHDHDAQRASTFGVGEMINEAVVAGASEILVGLGGSSTVDGGWGMASAGGYKFYDSKDEVMVPGRDRMCDVTRVESGAAWPGVPVTALCDVNVPFGGETGSVIFAGQKGVPNSDYPNLLTAINRFMYLAGGSADLEGMGAAGGLGFGLATFASARLVSGSNWILDHLGFAEAIAAADAVLVVEGRFDATSTKGKLAGTVIEMARKKGIPVGVLAPGWDGTLGGVDGVHVFSGGGHWSSKDLEVRTRDAVRALFT